MSMSHGVTKAMLTGCLKRCGLVSCRTLTVAHTMLTCPSLIRIDFYRLQCRLFEPQLCSNYLIFFPESETNSC